MKQLDNVNSSKDLAKRGAKRCKSLPPSLRKQRLQKATRAWLIEEFEWKNARAVTLTLKKGIEVNGNIVMGDRYQYGQNLRHFLNLLNKTIFGGMAHAGWQFSVASFFERSSNGLPHFHLIISKPAHLPDAYFNWLINRLWGSTTWGRRINHVVPVTDSGWIDYITKFKTKEAFDEALELRGTYRCEVSRKVPFRISMKRCIEYIVERCRESAAIK